MHPHVGGAGEEELQLLRPGTAAARYSQSVLPGQRIASRCSPLVVAAATFMACVAGLLGWQWYEPVAGRRQGGKNIALPVPPSVGRHYEQGKCDHGMVVECTGRCAPAEWVGDGWCVSVDTLHR